MRYILSLGSNLGDRRENLLRAMAALRRARVKVVDASSVYSTEPVSGPARPWFYNQVIKVESALSPGRLLVLAKKIEREMGRRPARRNGPRKIDIDILLAGRRTFASPKLIIPHPRMAERNFVLIPLKEIAPRAVHPVLGVRIETLARHSADRSAVRRVGPPRSGGNPARNKEGRRLTPQGVKT